MNVEFEGQIISWRGPAPYLFVPVPPRESNEIKKLAKLVSYGWGVIPAKVTIGQTTYNTSLFPKDGAYLVPVKVVVQKAESLELGDTVQVQLEIAMGPDGQV
jgi:hypothetical protein